MVTTQEKFSGNTFACERTGCGQIIFWKENQGIFVNMYDGPGGNRGLRHACVNRQERYKISPSDKFTNIKNCPRCDRRYDASEIFDCPYCWKQCCQNCGSIFVWTIFHRNCPRCHDMRSRQIQMTRFAAESANPDPRTGKYKRIYLPRPPEDIQEEVGLIVGCYHRLKDKWKEKGMKMKCVMSNCRNDVEDRSDYCVEHIRAKAKY